MDEKANAEKTDKSEIFQPGDYNLHFDPEAYLDYYYSQRATEGGLKVMLFALPIFARRIPERKKSLLDVGSGPTVYVAMCFRDYAEDMYLSDYLESNLEELRKWLRNTDHWNWSAIAKSIAFSEGEPRDWNKIENSTRSKIRGIFFCDVLLNNMIPDVPESQSFDIVVSIFCLESASSNYQEYCQAMANVTKCLNPGGYFILGSVMGESSYEFGGKRHFHILNLNREQVVNAMDYAGIDTNRIHSQNV